MINKVKDYEPDTIVKVSINCSTVMTNEFAERFIKEFSESLHRNSILPYIEKFHGDISELKKTSKCGKYRTGMILLNRCMDMYVFIVDIIDTSIFCIVLKEYEYNILHEKCLHYMTWNTLPLELLSYTGMYSYGVIYTSDDTGIINNFYEKDNIDSKFELIEELSNSVLCYLLPEIQLRGGTKYKEI